MSERDAFQRSADDPNLYKVTVVGEKISNLARNQKGNVLAKDGSIEQTERLFTARARYGLDKYAMKDGVDASGSRGQWAYIRLLTSDKQYKQYLQGSTEGRKVTYSELIGEGGTVASMSDPGVLFGGGYDKFLITGVSCDMSEKVQISEVFGDNEVVYYFGRQPLVFNISGVLIDSPDNTWFEEWFKMYSEFLRGTQLARNYELVRLVLPNMVLTGSISQFGYQQNSSRDVDIPFGFTFIAKVVEPLPLHRTSGAMVRSNLLKGVDFSKVQKFVGQGSINSLKAQLTDVNKVIQNPNASLREKGSAMGKVGSGVGGAFGVFLENSKNTIDSYSKQIEKWDSQTQNAFNKVQRSAAFQTVTSALNGIRTNLFSPVYGVLNSLTKLVRNVFNSATSLFNSAITPVRNILRDITNISKEAISLVNLVDSSLKGLGRNVTGELRGLQNDYKTAIKTLKKAAGTIASAPQTLSQSIRTMFANGSLSPNAAFLRVSPKLTFIRPTLTLSGKNPTSKINLISGVNKYSAQAAAKLSG